MNDAGRDFGGQTVQQNERVFEKSQRQRTGDERDHDEVWSTWRQEQLACEIVEIVYQFPDGMIEIMLFEFSKQITIQNVFYSLNNVDYNFDSTL